MPLKIEEYPVAEVVPDTEAELDTFRAQWKVVRRWAKALALLGNQVAIVGGVEFVEDEYGMAVRAYLGCYHDTFKQVQQLMGLATKLSPEARATVEAGIGGPLFEQDGSITQWWRDLWIGPEVKAVSLVRRRRD